MFVSLFSTILYLFFLSFRVFSFHISASAFFLNFNALYPLLSQLHEMINDSNDSSYFIE